MMAIDGPLPCLFTHALNSELLISIWHDTRKSLYGIYRIRNVAMHLTTTTLRQYKA